MASKSRTGFIELFWLFLRRMPSVWVGGAAATLVALVLRAAGGVPAAVAGVVVVVAVSAGVEFWIDRRRGVARIMRDNAEEMQRRRMVGRLLQHFSTDVLGGQELA